MKALATIVLALLLSAPAAFGQERPALRAGDRLRVAPFPRGTLTVVVASGDTLWVRGRQDTTRVPVVLGEVSRVSRDVGARSRLSGGLRGGLLGLTVGAVGGALAGLVSGDDEGGWFTFTAEEKALILGTGLGGMGAVLGAAGGALFPGRRWEALHIPRDAERPSGTGSAAPN